MTNAQRTTSSIFKNIVFATPPAKTPASQPTNQLAVHEQSSQQTEPEHQAQL